MTLSSSPSSAPHAQFCKSVGDVFRRHHWDHAKVLLQWTQLCIILGSPNGLWQGFGFYSALLLLFFSWSLVLLFLSPSGTQTLEYSRPWGNAYWMSEFIQERKLGDLKCSICSLACIWFQWDVKYLSPPVLPTQWKNRSKSKKHRNRTKCQARSL